MPNYTSSLPETTLTKLSEMATKLNVSKNKIIEKALEKYMKEVERQMYILSFKKLKGDKEMMQLADEGMAEYRDILKDWDEKK